MSDYLYVPGTILAPKVQWKAGLKRSVTYILMEKDRQEATGYHKYKGN